MRFQVPQFIEIEDKIFGPLTFKQFVYVAGGAGMAVICYKVMPFLLAIPFCILTAGFGIMLAFYKVNNKPFIEMLEAAFKYSLGNKLYIWKKTPRPAATQVTALPTSSDNALFVPRLSDSKLKDLTWSLDINETIYSQQAKKLTNRASHPGI